MSTFLTAFNMFGVEGFHNFDLLVRLLQHRHSTQSFSGLGAFRITRPMARKAAVKTRVLSRGLLLADLGSTFTPSSGSTVSTVFLHLLQLCSCLFHGDQGLCCILHGLLNLLKSGSIKALLNCLIQFSSQRLSFTSDDVPNARITTVISASISSSSSFSVSSTSDTMTCLGGNGFLKPPPNLPELAEEEDLYDLGIEDAEDGA